MSAASSGKEMTKTLLFVGAAVLSLTVAFISRPSTDGDAVDDEVGKPLFADISTTAANGLEVLSYDEELGEMKRFKVAQQDQGIWAIPSHQNYPADAQDRLVNAATMFVDLDVINVVSEIESDHVTFGVVEPSVEDTKVGDEGVGTMVTVFGKSDDGQTKLADLVIGKAVKGMDGQHYVRRPGKSSVYQVKIDPSQLSTKFEDWIETDLLKLSSFDVSSLTMKDYSVESQRTLQGFAITNYDQRLEVKVSDEDGTWTLDRLKEFSDGELRVAQLEPGEELSKERLDTLKNALGDLKIVDVERKPKGLGADLRADKAFMNDMDSKLSLANKGFFAVTFESGDSELWCSDGELLVDTKDGIRYTLRFGQIAGIGEESTSTDDQGKETTESSVNRYMFVSVQLNEDHFPEPDLEPLPEGAGTATAEGDAGEGEGAADAEDADKNDANELALEVERINKANQRKIDERNDQIETARKKASELSYRFADWYYVVSDDVFKKLRLRRGEIIQFSEEALKSGTGLSAFRYLQEEGLTPTEATTPGN